MTTKMTERPLDQAKSILEALEKCPDEVARLNVLRDALQEGYRYRVFARYLASGFASLLEDAPKITSRTILGRLRLICTGAAGELNGTKRVHIWDESWHASNEGCQSVVERCLAAAKMEK